MSAPFMQFYIADYLGDTQHLTTEQHGAYLLLLMGMWRAGGSLPNDEAKLARIAGLTLARWRRIGADVLAFCDVADGRITQKRLVAEIEKAEKKSQVRADAGRQSAKAKALKNNKQAPANAGVLLKHSSDIRYQISESSSLRSEDARADEPAAMIPIPPTPPPPPPDPPPATRPSAAEIDYDRIRSRLIEAGGITSASPRMLDISPILALIHAGYSLETDILPFLRSRKGRFGNAQSWVYVARTFEGARQDAAARTAPPPKPERRPEDPEAWPPELGSERRRFEMWADDYWPLSFGPRPGTAGSKVPLAIFEAWKAERAAAMAKAAA